MNNNIDWNWFFSSFSQSAAALLGIIGAFIISRLIGIDEKANILASEFEDLKIMYNKIKDSLSVRKYKWINRTLIKYNSDIIKQIRNREFEGLSEKEILEKLYNQDSRLYKDDQSILKTFNELYKKYKPGSEIKLSITIVDPFIPSGRLISKISPEGIWNKIEDERDLISKLLIDAKELIGKFNKHLLRLKNFSGSLNTIRVIVLILIISFPCIVIYPLYFLPLKLGEEPTLTYNFMQMIRYATSLKNILLGIFLVTVEGIFIYFLFLIKRIKLRLSNLEKEHLEKYRNIYSYCNYYRGK